MGVTAALAVVHCLAVWHHYFVGSFDDDANYILTAKALLSGQGLTGHLLSGDAVIGGYPPGFPLLLVPIEMLRSHSLVPFQVLSVVCYVAVLPLTWIYLGRRGVTEVVRVATVALLALNPVMATFGVMVMAEMPFLVCLLVYLLVLERWEASPRAIGPIGLLAVALGAELVWLKEAGIALVLGVALWLALRRSFARAAAVLVGLGLLLLPVVVARLVDGVPLAGTRYSQELGSYYGGGLVSRLVDVLPSAAWHYVTVALPASIVATGAPFPTSGPWATVISVLTVQASVFVAVGLVVAVRHYRDVAVIAIPAYVAESVLWPEVNERRVILVLPVLMAWYVLGIRTTVVWLAALAKRWSLPRLPCSAGISILGIVVILVPLSLQFPRDYLFGLHQDSSHPQGSRYMAILKALHPHTTLVETDYKYTTALFSGHHTADNAFLDVLLDGCSLAHARSGLAADDAGFLLLGALNKPNLIDNSCLFSQATTQPWAVRLLRTTRDEASVFELIGPGTAHPDLADLTASAPLTASGGLIEVPMRSSGAGDHPGDEPTTLAVDGVGSFTWSFSSPHPLSQLSIGEAGVVNGVGDGVQLQYEEPDGAWRTVAAAPRGVGDAAGDAPFLLATLPPGTEADAVRVVVHGAGQLKALDIAALGPNLARTP